MSGHTITLKNRGGAQIVARPGQSILEAAEAAGIALPFGCRYGCCRICAARLVAGKVAIQASADVDRELLAERVFLACVTSASGDCEIEVGELTDPLLPPHRRRAWTE